MMFALGVIDKLTGMNLAGGRFIAGAGESPPAGRSGRSAVSSRRWSAHVTQHDHLPRPAGNCADTKGAVPAGLRS